MSHLTASPFHKPSPFEFPHRTSSADTIPAAAQLPTPASIVGGPDIHSGEYFETPAASVSPDAPGSRFRRAASSIVYHNSGLRESRERTVQRSSRSFVIVLPPPSLPQDHGHLGHTLGSGPRHRLAQGLLMPLFPTMFGQLTAIAREYNFPSTTGLCLYLHFTEHGITATPRISDDSWQMIWSHAFDPNLSNSANPSLPISGKIEFDIDLRLARWYGAWMASSHREQVDVPMSVTPSAAPSIIHYREESRTTFADNDDQDTNTNSLARPPPRHVPRKLSLIDRFDAMSARSVPRSVVRPPPQEPLPGSGSQNLSPIFQEDEPKTAKHALENRVNSWRASASIPPAEVGHILLSGANLPNSPLDESPLLTSNADDRNDGEYEYRIEDYSFSISSAGPGDYDPYSPLTWYHDPSVHLAHRAQGSVCMTPSDCTSFGPSDYTLPSYVPSLDLDGVRTPDIADRMLEDCPPSPSVATSWGAPMSYPPSPTSEHRAPSVDLGDRQCFSRPVTPMTATSWGAPECYPPSPTTPFYVQTPDAGQRTFDLSSLSEHDAPWSMVWPYHDASRPWTQVWPYQSGGDQVPSQEEGQDRSEAPNASATGAWNMVWPYHASAPAALNMVRPHTSSGLPASRAFARSPARYESGPIVIRRPAAYPMFDLYPATYPGNLDEIYPAVTIDDAPFDISTRLSPRYPTFDLYPAMYPHIVPYPPFQYEMEEDLACYYPHFNLYPPIATFARSVPPAAARRCYCFNIYPSVPPSLDDLTPTSRAFSRPPARYASPKHETEEDSSSYYPHFNLYPPISTSARRVRAPSVSGPISVLLRTAYPVFNLYPAIYPAFDIYPAMEGGQDSLDGNSVSIQLTAAYPFFNLYPAVYPFFDLYPALPEDRWETRVLSTGYPDFNIYPAVSRSRQTPRMQSVASKEVIAPIIVRIPAMYPLFDLYPPVYPVLEIYPEIPEDCTPGSRGVPGVSVRLAACYPVFNLYPAVYPDFEIYPALPQDCTPGSRVSGVSVRIAVAYPIFDLYPAVYPAIEIYPSLPEDCLKAGDKKGIHIGAVARYPVFNLYPAVYPFFDLYPGAWNGPEDNEVDIRVHALYPYFNIYPAIYPHFELWPTLSSMNALRIPTQSRFTRSDLHALVKKSSVNLTRNVPGPSKTHQALHMAVFPESTTVSTPSGTVQRPNIRIPSNKTHFDLHLAVFPSGVAVSTPSGTTALKDQPATSSPAPRLSTRLRSGSVLRNSLPPSPRPIGGRSPVARTPPPSTPIPAPPTDGPQRTASMTTRHSVAGRIAQAGGGGLLTRSVSMASKPASVPEPTQLDRTASVNGPRVNARRRDSLVLQRVRAFQMQTEQPIKEDDPISSFPLPPRSVQPPRKLAS
ncbi:hypothetical protein C8R43DRAFT_389321 [Mycena crocata]|nr:hypothetical protein C8R43DRAFT_389321 [Mycena crocata]